MKHDQPDNKTTIWHPISTVPADGMVIVRGADGVEHRYSGGWTECTGNIVPTIPKEWRYMVEEVDL